MGYDYLGLDLRGNVDERVWISIPSHTTVSYLVSCWPRHLQLICGSYIHALQSGVKISYLSVILGVGSLSYLHDGILGIGISARFDRRVSTSIGYQTLTGLTLC